jgi:tetratricopeptide (TPR) repeat protein
MANVYVTRGDLDGAMRLYQQSLETFERLGDLRGKSATLHEMANVLVTRGDLDGAMRLYQQSLEIKERLGDLKGKSATLHEMAGRATSPAATWTGRCASTSSRSKPGERLGDLRGKSATLHQMAYMDGAMKLYQQSLELEERLGDLRAGHPRRPGRGDAPLPAVARNL